MKLEKLGVSLVLYKESEGKFLKFLDNLNQTFEGYILEISVVLNSRMDFSIPRGINIIEPDENIGYGKGHNLNFYWLSKNVNKIIITNTDLYLEGNPYSIIDGHNAILSTGTVINHGGEIQKVTRSFPNIYDKIHSFFFSYKSVLIQRGSFNVPHISGCFFIVDVHKYNRLGFDWLFDPVFFMYEEDTDLCRRIWGKGVIFRSEEIGIYHDYAQGSSRSIKLFIHHLKSILHYFRKWGFFDSAAKDSKDIIRRLNCNEF